MKIHWLKAIEYEEIAEINKKNYYRCAYPIWWQTAISFK